MLIGNQSREFEQRREAKDKQRADPEDLNISNLREQFPDVVQSTARSLYTLYYQYIEINARFLVSNVPIELSRECLYHSSLACLLSAHTFCP
jgi:hypothetical protein